MTPAFAVLAAAAGAAGGWLAYLLVNRRSRPRHAFERPIAIAVPALLFPALGLKFGFGSPALAVYAGFTLIMVGVTIFDLRTQEIPHCVTLPGAAAGLLLGAAVLPPGFIRSLAGLLFGGGVLIVSTLFEAARNKEVGGGDWKYAGMIGAFLGWPGVLTALVLTGVFGVAGALILKNRAAPGPQALGPWLSAGALGALLVS